MFLTFRRVGRIPAIPALAAAAVIVIVGGLAVTVLAIVAVVGWGAWLLRALGLMGAERALAPDGDGVIEGVVVSRSFEASGAEPASGRETGPPNAIDTLT